MKAWSVRSDDAGDGLRGRGDYEQVGCLAQLLHGFDGFDPLDLVVWVDKADRPFEPGAAKISQNRPPADVSRGLAPTTATDRGENSLSRRYVDMGRSIRR